MKVAFFSAKSYDKAYFNQFNNDNRHDLTFFEVPLNEQTASLTAGFEAVCVFVNDVINQKTIEEISANGIKVIALRCAGFNNVDLKAAKSRNIKVVRVPAYSPESVAEHAVALILTLNRKTHKAYNRVREGNYSIENLTGFNLFGKTVGVIGTGLIGVSFCKIMLGFGCKVLAYDIRESEELVAMGVQYKALDEVFTNSDIISLHCPLNPQTAYMINQISIAKMKDGVMLINTSRGALMNTRDAIDGLKTGKIGFLGIDVYEQEADLFFQDLSEIVIQDDVIARLISFPNVLITGHLGFFTKEALEEIATITLGNLSDFESGKGLVNEVKG
ncbi:2-hydroxyacid dehydrogenase [Dyadobacter sp. LHD-138]|uniref:2-hydroxyacid dehydrogenase n=1 Tax=Dyadobacter sp. LHD-138 TaxID=3071413 RepID=UPI0027E1492B|nr:2-hydroxyacid dehydrogenase [Dyadobacter sp. LHD-138]MDQ6476964.1 2-hydroxyacid dehydrogenase [Dyadobacter sp. LHD-138]